MSGQENKDVVRRFVDAMSRNELDVLPEMCTEEVASAWRDGINNGHPYQDHHLEIRRMAVDGDDVVVLMGTSGAVVGELHGVNGNGKRFTNEGVVWFRVLDGRIAEVRPYFDDVVMLQQMGAPIG